MAGISQSKKVEAREGNSFMSLLSSILKEIAEFKGWELIFQGLLYGFLAWALYNLKIMYEFHTDAEWAHITKYSIYDFKLALVFVAVFLGYKIACHRIFFNVIKNRLDPAKFPTEEDRNTRAKTSCYWVGNIIYYSCSTITCFLLFKDQDFFPKDLGGTAEPIKMYEGVPGSREYPYAVLFYMVQFGRHLHTFIDYCVYKWNTPKFWEMFLHHSTAVFLIFFSYLTNNLRVGILVLFVHDPSDIFLCSARLIESFKNHPSSLKYANYILFIASWVFFRLYAFPKCIVGSAISAYWVYEKSLGRLAPTMVFLMVLLSALVILHFYWFIFILRILVTMLRGKKNYNLYDTAAKNKKADGVTAEAAKESKD